MPENVTKEMNSGANPFPDFPYERSKKNLWLAIGVIALLILVAMAWLSWGLSQREKGFEDNLSKRLEVHASSQAQLIKEMLHATVEQANRVISSELFKLYAAEVHLIEDDISLLVTGPLPGKVYSEELQTLAKQLPMMRNLLLDFTRISGYQSGRVVNRSGKVFISTDATGGGLRSDQQSLIEKTLERREPLFGAMRSSPGGLTVDTYLPIFSPGKDHGGKPPVAVLILSQLVGNRLEEMRNSSLMEPGERIRWLQKTADGFQEIVPWVPGQLQKIATPLTFDGEGRIPFGVRESPTGQKVYTIGLPIDGPEWWVVAEADFQLVRQNLRQQQKALIGVTVLFVLFFMAAAAALRAFFTSSHERKNTRYFEQMAQEIDKQRQLLDQINNHIADYIALYDLQGRLQYVNPAFAAAAGRTTEEMIGLDREAIFGFDTGRRLDHSDQRVLAEGTSHIVSETVYLQSKPHHLQISKAPLKDRQGRITGIVSVSRDVTESVTLQQRQEQATRKTLDALVRAIELTDPYLAGHSQMMRSLGIEVAKALNAADVDIATIETAANLSEIGKLFIDRELLFKEGPLTAEEKKRMEKHVVHAGKVLKDIDFGLPVYEAVTQMNESLDGSGYPRGLKGDEVIFTARVLAVVNSFCAMVKPRAYRGARSIEETMGILRQEENVYDQRVVAALEEVVRSALGEKLLARFCEKI
ncbi:MAG: PAS domain-containing protein [Desulfuromonadaceae bacterium]|nr:PAS domain-containing protein [Desulfuromonadaceae bacterium]